MGKTPGAPRILVRRAPRASRKLVIGWGGQAHRLANQQKKQL